MLDRELHAAAAADLTKERYDTFYIRRTLWNRL